MPTPTTGSSPTLHDRLVALLNPDPAVAARLAEQRVAAFARRAGALPPRVVRGNGVNHGPMDPRPQQEIDDDHKLTGSPGVGRISP